ncbi:2-C-methyl-D-erythritol 4-phosphate cytidylyltransferase [Desulfofalx alkaliphila]|uniref:2-C-methyl-D-erythritol 4-phosphate cytidylyltransferase n=1 Tax=Desulfofalx alkaliphila TaxID=105483 RepID=UPI000AEFDF7F|nr:2-C-methyl-D-erythritol 4-phosphate cytidylyltransferase [Desulfofalx alkaliphila]
MAKVYAVIAAAGTGSRMGTKTKKQYLELNKLPILVHTLNLFEHCSLIDGITLVVGREEISWCQEEIVAKFNYSKVLSVVPGGDHRQQSVYRGLMAVPARDEDLVVIHDGARPLLTEDLLTNAVLKAREVNAVVIAVPVKDTIKWADGRGRVTQTPPRDSLWAAQTPQIFNCKLLKEAHKRALAKGFVGTDDASLVEDLGHAVHLVPGSYENIKITTPEDLLLAEEIIKRRKAFAGGNRV